MDMSIAQMEGRMEEIAGILERLHAHEDFTDDDATRFQDLTAEYDELRSARDDAQRRQVLEAIKGTLPGVSRTRGDNPKELDADPIGEPDSIEYRSGSKNPWDLSEMRTYGRSPAQVGDELRARALDAVARVKGANDARRSRMTEILEEWDSEDGKIARLVLATTQPEYVRAFAKLARDRQNALTDEERAAVDRTMSLTDAQGGFLVPFQLDPTVIITSDGARNDIRAAARQVVATGDTWNGVSAGATSWSWDAEEAEVSDDASTFVQPSIPIYKGAGFIPISVEALADEANVSAEVGRLLAFGKTTLENAAFATGSGSAQPTGIVTALTGTGSVVNTTTADTFGLVDVYALDEGVPARYRTNGSWLAHRAIYNDVRQFDTSGGAALWTQLGSDVPSLLLGRPAYESESMSSTPSGTNLHFLIFGDFDNYVIADRVGTTVEFVPQLFGANYRPTGQKGWYAYFRVGADSVNDGAFRILNGQ